MTTLAILLSMSQNKSTKVHPNAGYIMLWVYLKLSLVYLKRSLVVMLGVKRVILASIFLFMNDNY